LLPSHPAWSALSAGEVIFDNARLPTRPDGSDPDVDLSSRSRLVSHVALVGPSRRWVNHRDRLALGHLYEPQQGRILL